MRFLVIILLILGAHFSLTANVPDPAGKAMFYWPFAADTKPTLAFLGLPKEVTQLLSAIAAAALIAAVLAVFGIVIPADWWVVLVVIGAIASALLYILYFGLFALLPLAIDAVLLWGVFVQHWTVAGLNGV